MDCCNYEYRAGGGYAPPGWEGYAPYAPLYAPYAHGYYAHAHHDPYARYYRYDYPHHAHHNDHVSPMDYGAYATKEARVRRALARRDARALPAQHLPLTPTPPLEHGLNNRGSSYCEPQMWSHYQMGAMSGGWSGSGPGGAWAERGTCARDLPRYPPDCWPLKGPQLHLQNQMCASEGRSTPYPVYEDSPYSGQNGRKQSPVPRSGPAAERARERLSAEPRRSPPREPRPPVVPLPAFQQAFGSTEIGKFAEAFSRTEVALEDASESFSYESFPEWDAPEPQWSSQPAAREVKCEDTF
ncbi:uncharacterized protein LOC134666035 [Cydia fagiglandana]|uniref:uncharacterized protein LOC134666035 n=1 Tax=Cydia fagiglandana TaxID=1458189 RepID=UPI002FEE5F27